MGLRWAPFVTSVSFVDNAPDGDRAVMIMVGVGVFRAEVGGLISVREPTIRNGNMKMVSNMIREPLQPTASITVPPVEDGSSNEQ